jgi:hypothetical protein
MNTAEILASFKHLLAKRIIPEFHKSTLQNVCAWNQIPTTVAKFINHYPVAFIVNTHSSSEPGEHWMALYIPSPTNYAEVFDSYGKGPQFWNVSLHSKVKAISFNSTYITNKRQLQSASSNLCGEYCIAFLTYRMQGKTFESFMKDFDLFSCCKNDLHVLAYVNRILKLDAFTKTANLQSQKSSCTPPQACLSLNKILCTC